MPSGCSTKQSKNHDVCARCHFAGLASGIDWTTRSSGPSGAVRAIVAFRTPRTRAMMVPDSLTKAA